MVADAQPVSNVSFNYYSATAPDIITYPALARCIWVDTHATPYVKRLYSSATSSWIIEVPAPGSITGDMIADSTITLAKIKASIYGPLQVAQVNAGQTAWNAVPAATLFSSTYPLAITSLSLSGVGAYVLSSNGVTNSWALFTSYFTAGVVPISSISTTGAPDPSVLSFVGGTLGYRTVANAAANDSIPITKVLHDAALNIPRTNAAGTATEWASPAQIVASLSPYITSGYRTPAANYAAVPAVSSSQPFLHGLGGTPFRAGARMICITADGPFAVGQVLDWMCMMNIGSDDGAGGYGVSWDNTNVYVTRPANRDLNFYYMGSVGYALTPANWKVAAWADLT